jgi:hypothetical protein
MEYYDIDVANNGGDPVIMMHLSGGGIATIDLTNGVNGSSPVIITTDPANSRSVYALSHDMNLHDLQRTWYDWADSQNYVEYTELYDASGQRYRQFGQYDDGGTWDADWDVTGAQPWSEYFKYYDAAGNKTAERGVYDSGDYWISNYDVNNTQPYTYYITYYDAAGNAMQQQAFYDAGGHGVTTWDPYDLADYQEYTTYYDAAGRADTQNGTYDPGMTPASWWTDFDQNNDFAWQSHTVTYLSDGSIYQQWLTMDDGSIVYL